MSYSMKSRIRYSEIEENGRLSLPALMNYFQDCCTFQVEDIGQGLYEIAKRDRTWVLSSWQVVIRSMPRLFEEVEVTTIPYEMKGFKGLRNFLMTGKDGEVYALANSFWTYINTKTGLPARITETDLLGYVIGERLQMDYAPRKIALPEHFTDLPPVVIGRQNLDTHHHVNNCQYVVLGQQILGDGGLPSQIRVEYCAQAFLGDTIYPCRGEGENGETILALLKSPRGDKPVRSEDTFAILELTGRTAD